jgi:MOSC domain-containing protein YiiM
MGDVIMINSESVGDPSRFRTLDELERMMAAQPGAPKDLGRVVLLVRKGEGGLRETPERVTLEPGLGLPGDAWGRREQPKEANQLAVMQHNVAELIANGQPLALFGDNLFLDLDLSAENLPPGSLVRLGKALLEVTPQHHTPCRKFRARFGDDAFSFVSRDDLQHLKLRGIYLRVVEKGEVKPGDPVQVISRPIIPKA